MSGHDGANSRSNEPFEIATEVQRWCILFPLLLILITFIDTITSQIVTGKAGDNLYYIEYPSKCLNQIMFADTKASFMTRINISNSYLHIYINHVKYATIKSTHSKLKLWRSLDNISHITLKLKHQYQTYSSTEALRKCVHRGWNNWYIKIRHKKANSVAYQLSSTA